MKNPKHLYEKIFLIYHVFSYSENNFIMIFKKWKLPLYQPYFPN